MGPDTTWAVKSGAIKERSLARVCFYSSADGMNKFSGHEKGVAQCRRDEREHVVSRESSRRRFH